MPRSHHTWKRTGKLLCAALVLAVSGIANAQVSCFISADPVIKNLQLMATRDATATLPLVQAEIDGAKNSPLPELDTNRMASLYAVQAQSYQVLELDGDARKSAQMGL